MHIIIGKPSSVGKPPQRGGGRSGFGLEAKLLAVRPPRRGAGDSPEGGERRRQSPDSDPAHGKVLVLLAPDGYHLPADLDSGNYRVFIRVVPR